jgi:alpha-L-fucosidase
VLCGLALFVSPRTLAAEPYRANWESLGKRVATEWFSDAKFGIYTYWGPVTVGSQDAERGRVQWYGMGMYQPKDEAFEFHRKRLETRGSLDTRTLCG